MRAIKFRIWSQLRNNYLTKGMSLLDIADDGGSLEWPLMIRESGNVFEQYTGVNDINEKEIYEGDIVKYARSKLESVESPKGVFSNRLIELGEDIGEIAFIEFQYVVSFDHKRSDDIEKLGYYPHRFEVIGNIHENPELLEEKK